MAGNLLSGEDAGARRCSRYYAERFRTVEINYTFYRMPTPKTTDGLARPGAGRVSVHAQGAAAITHDQRLKDAGDALAFFCESARVLGPHLAPLLFQLPPNLECDLPSARDVPRGHAGRHAAGLRVPSRVVAERRRATRVLRAHKAALCIADFGDKTTPLRATARHGYFRLRDEGYTPADLERWAGDIQSRAGGVGRRVRVSSSTKTRAKARSSRARFVRHPRGPRRQRGMTDARNATAVDSAQ